MRSSAHRAARARVRGHGPGRPAGNRLDNRGSSSRPPRMCWGDAGGVMKFRGAIVTIFTLVGIVVLAIAVGVSTLSPPAGNSPSHITHGPPVASKPLPRGTARVPAHRPSQGRSEPQKKPRSNPRPNRDRNRASHTVRKYTVRPGDTLWSISHSTPQHPLRWLSLWHKNLESVPNPRVIYVGEVLRL